MNPRLITASGPTAASSAVKERDTWLPLHRLVSLVEMPPATSSRRLAPRWTCWYSGSRKLAPISIMATYMYLAHRPQPHVRIGRHSLTCCRLDHSLHVHANPFFILVESALHTLPTLTPNVDNFNPVSHASLERPLRFTITAPREV